MVSATKIVQGERNTKKGRRLFFYFRAAAYLGRQPKCARRAEYKERPLAFLLFPSRSLSWALAKVCKASVGPEASVRMLHRHCSHSPLQQAATEVVLHILFIAFGDGQMLSAHHNLAALNHLHMVHVDEE